MSGSLMTLDQGAGGLFPQFPDVGGGAFDDIYFDPDDTYYIGYDPDIPFCGRPRQINVTRRIDLGGTSSGYEPVLNLLFEGSCTVPVIRGFLQGTFQTSPNGVAIPVELYGGGPFLALAGFPVFIHSDKTLNSGAREGAVILAGYEAVARSESEFDRIVEVGLENGDGNNLDIHQYFAGNRQLIATGLAEVGESELIGYGKVPSEDWQEIADPRGGLEARDDGALDPVCVTLWGKRQNAAYAGAGGDDGVNAQVIADIDEAAINADHVVLMLRWRDNSNTETDLFTFKESEMEIISAAQAAVLGTSADGAAAIGVQIGAENDFTTEGARLVEFVNNAGGDVRGYIDLNGDVGFSRLDNGQGGCIETLTELTTILAAATTTTAIQIPAGALVFAVSVRVVTVIPTSTDFDVGTAADATRYGAGLNVAAGTTFAGTTDAMRYYVANTGILLTMNGGNPAAATGQVRVTIHFIRITPPTS